MGKRTEKEKNTRAKRKKAKTKAKGSINGTAREQWEREKNRKIGTQNRKRHQILIKKREYKENRNKNKKR